MSIELKGIHHLTAVSAKIRDNHHFYTGTMGMRLVKRSVNQDDVSAYHLFYADAKGTPGTDLTFFDWPVPTESRGSRSISRTSLRVAGADALDYWKARLGELGVRAGEIAERDGRLTLDLEDAEGQRLSLVDDQGAGESNPWDRSPVPAEHQIRGLGPIALSVPTIAPTDAVLRGRSACVPCASTRIRRTRATWCTCTRWDRAGWGRSCTSPNSGASSRRGRAPEACITWPSARTTRTTTRGPRS